MNVFLAGNTGTMVRELGLLQLAHRRLSSFFFIKDDFFLCGQLFKELIMKHPTVDLFLDSGAYSAFTQGVSIDIYEYIDFIKKYKKHLTLYANLDVIGDAEATLKNQKIMEKAGLKPLPCFHFGEDMKYLRYYVDNYEYLGLGMAGNRNAGVLSSWLDQCFSIICDQPGHLPKIKIHGYAMTSVMLMLRYPWYSVDSTSWVIMSRLGQVFVPRVGPDGKPLFDERVWKVQVSSRSNSKEEKGKHINTFPPHQKEQVLRYFKAKGYRLGSSKFKTEKSTYELKEGERWFGKEEDGARQVEVIVEPGLCNDYCQRDELNVHYFLDLEKTMKKWPWSFTRQAEQGFGL